MNRKTIVTFLAAASLALGAGVASAQGWGGCGGGGGGWGGHHRGGGGCGDCYTSGSGAGGGGWVWSEEAFKERMTARHEKMKELLKITPDQEVAWKTFNEQMLALAGERTAARPDQAEFANLSAPERMEKRLEFSRKSQDMMGKRLEVLKTFYASLTAEQKEIFDDMHSAKRWGDGERGWKKDGKKPRKDGQKNRWKN